MCAITRTPFGRMSNAVRDNPERAEFVGYNPQRVRFIVFCLSGFFAGIAGGIAAVNFEIVTPASVQRLAVRRRAALYLHRRRRLLLGPDPRRDPGHAMS